jgi:hypothetical protein
MTLNKEAGSSSHSYIFKAATNIARRDVKSPFTELVYCLNAKWDDDVRLLGLCLINILVVQSPSDKKQSQFLARLENIGLYNEMRSLANIKDNPKISTQL